MRLPDEFFIQCACGNIIKADFRFVTDKRQLLKNRQKQRDTVEETNALIRAQLCKCGHMKFIHDKAGTRPCVRSGCNCTSFQAEGR